MALNDNLVAAWLHDETTNTEDRVDVFSTNDLTVSGTVEPATPKIGIHSSAFDDLSADHLEINPCPIPLRTLGVSRSITVAGWVKFNTVSREQAIVGQWGGAGANQSWTFTLNSSGFLELEITKDGLSYSKVTSTVLLSISVWYYVQAYYDKDLSKIGVRVNDGTANEQSVGSNNPRNLSQRYEMGTRRDGAFAARMDGFIDQFSHWDVVKSEADRDEIYNSGGGLAYSLWDVAVDLSSENIRRSLLEVLPVPDGVIDNPDRGHILDLYAGFVHQVPSGFFNVHFHGKHFHGEHFHLLHWYGGIATPADEPLFIARGGVGVNLDALYLDTMAFEYAPGDDVAFDLIADDSIAFTEKI